MTNEPEGLSGQFSSSPAELESLYDDWAEGYDDDMDAWGYDVPEMLATLLEDRGVIGPVLDAGCGTGRSGAALADAGLGPLTGIDLSEESLEHARRRGVYRDLRAVDLTGPLPYPDDSFAAVASAGVLSYLPDTRDVLLEFLRVVVPAGVVVFSQRTDLWADRRFDQILDELSTEGRCVVSRSEPRPYLPGHPEFGDEILVIYVELQAV